MRSDLVFGAYALIPNRFLLSRLAAKATRAFHRPGTRIQDTTNGVLERFSRAASITDVQASPQRAILPVRRQKAAPPSAYAPKRLTPARISRVERASVELQRLLGDSHAQPGAESALDQRAMN